MPASVDFARQGRKFPAMKRLAAMMMFAAWLLYGAMPAMAVPGTATMSMATSMSVEPSAGDHAQHHGIQTDGGQAKDGHASHADRGIAKPCPHGSSKGCVAPFCAACLVLPPDTAFGETGRFIHANPEPQDGPSLVLPAARPPTPPPRT
jgi:hypothetical protein